MELKDYLRMLRAHWVGVLVLALGGVAIAGLYTVTQPRVYAAGATGFVSSGASENPALGSVADSLAKSRAKSYVDIAKGLATAQAVIEELDLDARPSALIRDIAVEQPLDTVVIKITARSATPEGARDLADAWVAALAAQVESIEDPKGTDAPGTLRVVPIEGAELPRAPVLPQTRTNLLLGLVLGLLLGAAYAYLRSQLDRRLRSATAVERQFGVTVVASIPSEVELQHAAGTKGGLAVDPHATGSRPSPAAEAFRKLRTNLQFMDVDNPPQVIVVTSPRQGDGKSTVAANLAAAIAVNGQPVTLIDGDLRRPTVAESFGLVEGAGLTDVLVGRVDMKDVTQQHPDYANLRVLAAGGTPPNPSELLGTQAMRKLLRTLARTSVVLVDAPPLLPVTDAAVLTALADGALVVISSGKTLDTELGAALGHLDTVNGKALGVIFNRVTRNDSEGGYYGEYYGTRIHKESAPVTDGASEDPSSQVTKPEPRESRSPARR
jgi:capsular exopolysaccharide synthesis family protein